MTGGEIIYHTRRDETFTGYLTAPDDDNPAPGILLISAIWGNDKNIISLADDWAADGFIVSVPDIFWRTVPGPTAIREVAISRYDGFDVDQGLLDIEDLIAHLKSHPGCNGKVAMLGFCFGGRYAHIGAARFGIDAAAAFHGTYIEKHLDESNNVTCPISFHFGVDDPVIPMDQVDAIKASYHQHANADITAHPGAGHNFSMPFHENYHPAVAKKSRDAVLSCFRSM